MGCDRLNNIRKHKVYLQKLLFKYENGGINFLCRDFGRFVGYDLFVNIEQQKEIGADYPTAMSHAKLKKQRYLYTNWVTWSYGTFDLRRNIWICVELA